MKFKNYLFESSNTKLKDIKNKILKLKPLEKFNASIEGIDLDDLLKFINKIDKDYATYVSSNTIAIQKRK
jgi:hypothetical protein